MSLLNIRRLRQCRLDLEEVTEQYNECMAERDGAMKNFAAALADLYSLSLKVDKFISQNPEHKNSVLTKKLSDLAGEKKRIDKTIFGHRVAEFGFNGRFNNTIVKNANFQEGMNKND